MILVTGATGKNGAEILKRLSGRKERIRAMVRKQNASASCSNELEFVEADFDDVASLRKALSGVQRAFLVTNSSERVEQLQLRFVDLARESGVKHIVYLSQLHASTDSPLRFLRYHAAVEDAIRVSGMSFTNLRPNLYMQGLLMIGQSIASQGRFFAPAGKSLVSVVGRTRYRVRCRRCADTDQARRQELRPDRAGGIDALSDGRTTLPGARSTGNLRGCTGAGIPGGAPRYAHA